MLREIARKVDDQAISSILWWALAHARESDTRRDLAELARIKTSGIYIAGAKTFKADDLVHLNDCTPAERKRLTHMSSAELGRLAKKQAKARASKAVQS